jgi:hypothetical protein
MSQIFPDFMMPDTGFRILPGFIIRDTIILNRDPTDYYQDYAGQANDEIKSILFNGTMKRYYNNLCSLILSDQIDFVGYFNPHYLEIFLDRATNSLNLVKNRLTKEEINFLNNILLFSLVDLQDKILLNKKKDADEKIAKICSNKKSTTLNEQCPVCLEDNESGTENCVVTTCRHAYHKKCFEQLLINGTHICALCRTKI